MTFPCNEVSSRTAGPHFKSCRVASLSLASCRGPVPLRSRNAITLLICHFFVGQDLESVKLQKFQTAGRRTASGISITSHKLRMAHFALRATRSERWLAVGPA